ncbi:MAG: hypothetical protein JSR28_06075 [Proteobacteria bacterium]|nr:hypothetical protein [Pseudomonadota bacterium]
MAAVKLALYKPHRLSDIGGRLVCWWTRSPYSHCELVVGDECYSSSIRDGGVRRKRIDISGEHWTVVPLLHVNPLAVSQLYASTKGAGYGWLDLLAQQVLRTPFEDRNRWFCSEWVASALGLARPETWTPGMLAEHYGVKS